MAKQYLTPVSDSFGDFTGAFPQAWFGNGPGGQITTNLWTYVREGTGSNPPAAGDGNVLLIPTNIGAGTASLVMHLSSGSTPAGQPLISISQSVHNDTGAISKWLLELRQHYVNESNLGTLVQSWDDTQQIVSQSLPAVDTIISHSVTGTITDYTDLSVRFQEISPSGGGDRAFLEWVTLVVDSVPPQARIWLGQGPISGAFTGAYAGDGSALTNITSSISASFAATSSLATSISFTPATASYALTASAAAPRFVVGTDPGGADTLRVSGTFNVGGTSFVSSGTGSVSHKAFGEFVPEVTWSSVTASGVKPNGTIWIQY